MYFYKKLKYIEKGGGLMNERPNSLILSNMYTIYILIYHSLSENEFLYLFAVGKEMELVSKIPKTNLGKNAFGLPLLPS